MVLENISGLPRVANLSSDDFVTRFLATKTPVIVEGAMDDWTALSEWRVDKLVDRFGARSVEVYGDFFEVDETTTFVEFVRSSLGVVPCKPGGYVRWFSNSGPERNVETDLFRQLEGEWNVPAFLPRSGYMIPSRLDDDRPDPVYRGFPYRAIFVSGAGGRTRLHRDGWTSSAVLCQVVGTKRAVFWAPDQEPYLMDDSGFLDPRRMDVAQRERFCRARPTFQATLHESEVLFIPSGWFHEVETLSDSVSLTWNFVHEVNEADFREFERRYPNDDELLKTARRFC